jgi:hypothetical protein
LLSIDTGIKTISTDYLKILRVVSLVVIL